MTRSSPSVQRIVAVLNFFGDHPDEAFTLTDVLKALQFSRATAHGLMTGLVEAGYLVRLSDKSYVLGPALARIGDKAQNFLSPLQAAQPEMRVLADEFDVVCSAGFRDGDNLIIRERAASRSHLGWPNARDALLPLRPPYAVPYFAWSPAEVVDSWIARLDPPASQEQIAAMRQAMEFARARGFHAVVRGEADIGIPVVELVDRLPATGPVVGIDGEGDGAPLLIRSITAPVFDANREVTFTLSLVGFTTPISAVEMTQAGDRLRAACDRVTAYIAGRKPN